MKRLLRIRFSIKRKLILFIILSVLFVCLGGGLAIKNLGSIQRTIDSYLKATGPVTQSAELLNKELALLKSKIVTGLLEKDPAKIEGLEIEIKDILHLSEGRLAKLEGELKKLNLPAKETERLNATYKKLTNNLFRFRIIFEASQEIYKDKNRVQIKFSGIIQQIDYFFRQIKQDLDLLMASYSGMENVADSLKELKASFSRYQSVWTDFSIEELEPNQDLMGMVKKRTQLFKNTQVQITRLINSLNSLVGKDKEFLALKTARDQLEDYLSTKFGWLSLAQKRVLAQIAIWKKVDDLSLLFEKSQDFLEQFSKVDEVKARSMIREIALSQKEASSLIALFSTIFAVFLLMIGVLLAHDITHPIYRLISVMGAIAKGDLSRRIALKREDEIGALAGSFDKMTADLEKAYKKIAELNVKLKERVDEQTKELIVTNEELDQRNEELLKALRLKSEFISTMTHEIKTPLFSILGYTELLLNKKDKNWTNQEKKNVERIHTKAQDLLKLIVDILDFSKLEMGRMSLHLETFSFEAVVDYCLELTSPLLKDKPIEVKKEIPPKLELKTDKTKLQHILINLISNAFKFSEKGEVNISAYQRENELYFSVADTGIGIAPENQEIIFQEFRQIDSTLKRKYGGTGIGLSLTKKLVNFLSGTIRVESQLGKGSVFHVSLPIDITKTSSYLTRRVA